MLLIILKQCAMKVCEEMKINLNTFLALTLGVKPLPLSIISFTHGESTSVLLGY
jgi:hypothetical protein